MKMTNEVPAKNRHPWSWGQFGIALGLIPIGLLCSFLALAVAMGVGSSRNTSDDWLMPIATFFLFAGPFIVGVGVIWVLVILIRRFLV